MIYKYIVFYDYLDLKSSLILTSYGVKPCIVMNLSAKTINMQPKNNIEY